MPLRARTYIGSSVRSTPSSVTRPESGAVRPDRHVEGRGLAGAVRAEQADDLAGIDFEADASNDGAAAVGLGEFVCAEGRGHHLRRRRGALAAALGLRADFVVAVDEDSIGRLPEGQRLAAGLLALGIDHLHRRADDDVLVVGRRVGQRVPVTVRLSTIAVTAPFASRLVERVLGLARAAARACRRSGCPARRRTARWSCRSPCASRRRR